MTKFVKKHLVARYGEKYNAACVKRRAELEVSFDYLATSLSTILNLSPGIQAGTSMHRSTGGSLISPASLVELLRKVDRAAYPAKSILPTLVPLAPPMGRHRSASVPIDPMPDRRAGPQDDRSTEREGPTADLRLPAVGSFQIDTSAQGGLIDIDESDNGSGRDNDLYLTLEGGSTYAPTEALRPGPPPSILSLSTDSLLSISSPASPGSSSASLLSISDTGADWDAQEEEAGWNSDSHSHWHSDRHDDTQREGDLQEQEYSFSTVATDGSLPSTLPLNSSPGQHRSRRISRRKATRAPQTRKTMHVAY